VGVLKESIQSIQRTSNSIVETVSRLPDETIRWKPAPEVWSIQEILSHVEEAVPYWADEIRRVVASPGTEWGRGHQNEARLAAVAASSRRSATEVLAGIQKGVQEAIAVLGKLRDEDLSIESPSRNPRFGTKPMSFVLDHLLVAHLRGHLGQIERNIDQFVAANEAAQRG
jgi:uncharacterized damage-inducible protein DinB